MSLRFQTVLFQQYSANHSRMYQGREFTKGGLVKGGLAIYVLKTNQIAKPPFTKPPFVNSRLAKGRLQHALPGGSRTPALDATRPPPGGKTLQGRFGVKRNGVNAE